MNDDSFADIISMASSIFNTFGIEDDDGAAAIVANTVGKFMSRRLGASTTFVTIDCTERYSPCKAVDMKLPEGMLDSDTIYFVFTDNLSVGNTHNILKFLQHYGVVGNCDVVAALKPDTRGARIYKTYMRKGEHSRQCELLYDETGVHDSEALFMSEDFSFGHEPISGQDGYLFYNGKLLADGLEDDVRQSFYRSCIPALFMPLSDLDGDDSSGIDMSVYRFVPELISVLTNNHICAGMRTYDDIDGKSDFEDLYSSHLMSKSTRVDELVEPYAFSMCSLYDGMQEQYRRACEFVTKMRDIVTIWNNVLPKHLRMRSMYDVFVELDQEETTDHSYDKLAPLLDFSDLEQFSKLFGIDHVIDAYFDGTTLEDILA